MSYACTLIACACTMSEIQEMRNSKKRDGEIRDMKRYSRLSS
jgi:hypothetical protein